MSAGLPRPADQRSGQGAGQSIQTNTAAAKLTAEFFSEWEKSIKNPMYFKHSKQTLKSQPMKEGTVKYLVAIGKES